MDPPVLAQIAHLGWTASLDRIALENVFLILSTPGQDIYATNLDNLSVQPPSSSSFIHSSICSNNSRVSHLNNAIASSYSTGNDKNVDSVFSIGFSRANS